MIDYFKGIILHHNSQEFYEHPNLDFKTKVSISTGEVEERKEVAEFGELEFEIIDKKYIYLRGSLHKFMQQGKNYGDFGFIQLKQSLRIFQEEFGLMPREIKLQNFEFGFNLKNLPFNFEELAFSIISLKGTHFNKMQSSTKKKELGIECPFQQYNFKIYDKGDQYKLADDLLRVEYKIRRMVKVRKIGIVTMADLLLPRKQESLNRMLVSTLKDVLFDDPKIERKHLSQIEKRLLDWGRNPRNWKSLQKSSPKNFDKKRVRFRKLIKQYGIKRYDEVLTKNIKEKFNEIMVGEMSPN